MRKIEGAKTLVGLDLPLLPFLRWRGRRGPTLTFLPALPSRILPSRKVPRSSCPFFSIGFGGGKRQTLT